MKIFKAEILTALLAVSCASIAHAQQPKGYSISPADLTNETQRQVVVDKEKRQYLGHPTTVLLEDNKTIIVVYPKGPGKNN